MLESVLSFLTSVVNTINKIVLTVFTVFIIVAGSAAWDLSNQSSTPSAAKCSGYGEATLIQKGLLKIYMTTAPWTVVDLKVVRVASVGDPMSPKQGDLVLVQLPFTGGTWYRNSDTN
jgi:hypothetical protein